MEPSFRPAQPADTELLLGLMRQLYALDGYSFEEGTARTALEGLVRDPGLGRVWVIGRDEEAIGYLVLTFGYTRVVLSDDVAWVSGQAAARPSGISRAGSRSAAAISARTTTRAASPSITTCSSIPRR